MKAAIVGCGGIAAVHAASISQFQGAVLTAFADIKKERAEDFAARYDGRAYGSLEEMLEQEKPDVLHICTPHYLHVPMAIYGLTHGVHVFMEKPPVISREQLAELEKAAAGTDRRLGFCFQNRYNPSVIKVKELLASGEAGKIRGARGIVTWSRGKEYYTESGWRGTLATEGGGALINQSVHTMDLLAYFLGTPLSVEAGIQNHHLKGIIEVEDTMEAYIRFADSTACFYATTAYCDDVPPLIEIACEDRTIRIEDLDVTYYYRDGRVEKPAIDKKEALGKSYWGCGHKDCIADFYRCVREEERFPQDLEGMKETILLMLGAYESAYKGKTVELAE